MGRVCESSAVQWFGDHSGVDSLRSDAGFVTHWLCDFHSFIKGFIS